MAASIPELLRAASSGAAILLATPATICDTGCALSWSLAAGDAHSMERLAEHFTQSADLETAYNWWAGAAKAGSVSAAARMGDAHLHGLPAAKVPCNATTAVRWWYRAAEAGDCESMHKLGQAYLAGCGVHRSHRLGVAWMLRGKSLEPSKVPAVLRGALRNYHLDYNSSAQPAARFKTNRQAGHFIAAVDLIQSWPAV